MRYFWTEKCGHWQAGTSGQRLHSLWSSAQWARSRTSSSRARTFGRPADKGDGHVLLIKSYGEFWNPETVDWGTKKLMGTRADPKNSKQVLENNYWNAKGVYVLHSEFSAVYVGEALGDSSGLGPRLDAHLTDRLIGRWDSFSWFSVSAPSASGGVNTGSQGGRHYTREEVVNALEALTILVVDPPLNRRRESLKGAVEVEQSTRSVRTLRGYLETILKRLPE